MLDLPGTGSIVNPDDDTLGLIKYLKENIGKLQFFAQKFFSDGKVTDARRILNSLLSQAMRAEPVIFKCLINRPFNSSAIQRTKVSSKPNRFGTCSNKLR